MASSPASKSTFWPLAIEITQRTLELTCAATDDIASNTAQATLIAQLGLQYEALVRKWWLRAWELAEIQPQVHVTTDICVTTDIGADHSRKNEHFQSRHCPLDFDTSGARMAPTKSICAQVASTT